MSRPVTLSLGLRAGWVWRLVVGAAASTQLGFVDTQVAAAKEPTANSGRSARHQDQLEYLYGVAPESRRHLNPRGFAMEQQDGSRKRQSANARSHLSP